MHCNNGTTSSAHSASTSVDKGKAAAGSRGGVIVSLHGALGPPLGDRGPWEGLRRTIARTCVQHVL